MGKTLEVGGAKVVVNSMLFHLPLGADPAPDAAAHYLRELWPEAERLGLTLHTLA